MSRRAAGVLDEVAREVDLLVYQLERPAPEDRDAERRSLRLELERLRDRLADLVRELE